MNTEATSKRKIEDVQRAAQELQSSVTPLILDPTDLNEERLLKLVAERYPGRPAMVSVSMREAIRKHGDAYSLEAG